MLNQLVLGFLLTRNTSIYHKEKCLIDIVSKIIKEFPC
jgi:hypothetical protein